MPLRGLILKKLFYSSHPAFLSGQRKCRQDLRVTMIKVSVPPQSPLSHLLSHHIKRGARDSVFRCYELYLLVGRAMFLTCLTNFFDAASPTPNETR